MAIPSRQIGWGTEENLLWQISKQLEAITGVAYNSSGGIVGPQGPTGSQGPQGVQGSQGVQGETGAALTVLGSYPDLTAFLAGAGGSPGVAGQAWLIESDGSLYIWNTATNAWEDVGDLQGPQGIQGEQGVQGEQGIQGIQGIQGVSGINGTSGTSGAAGTNGTSGTSFNPILPVVYGLYAQTADSTPVTATTVESSLIGTGVGTLSFPANGFSIGDSFIASLSGIITCVGSATIIIKIKTLGGIILADSGIIALDAATNKKWQLDIDFTIRNIGIAGVASISSGGVFQYIKNSGTNFEAAEIGTVNNTTFNTTINNTLIITAQWNTTNAGNSIFSRNFTLNKIY